MARPLRFPTVTEAELRRILKPVAFNAALRDLELGYPRERRQYANGVAVTRWETAEDTPVQVMYAEKDSPFLIECTCDDFAELMRCQHSNAASVAWARLPKSFAVTTEEFPLDELFEMLDGVLDVDDLAEMFGGEGLTALEGGDSGPAGASGEPPPLPVVMTPSSTGELRAVITAPEVPLTTQELRVVLEPLNVNQLRQVAQRRKVAISGVKRDVILETLVTALSRPEALAEVWPSLSANARLVLSVMPYLTTNLGVLGHALNATLTAFHPEVLPRLEPALKELTEAGLVSSTPYGYYQYPLNLASRLPPDAAVLPAYADPARLRVTAAPATLDFAMLTTRLLLALHSGGEALRARPAPEPQALEAKLPNLARGWPYMPGELEAILRQKNPAQAVNRYAFSVPPAPPLLTDEARAALSQQLAAKPEVIDFALRLLVARGYMRLEPGAAPQVDQASFVSALSQHPLTHVLPLFSSYAIDASWTEFDLAASGRRGLLLAHPGNLHGSYTLKHLLADLAIHRQNLLLLLRRAPAGAWIDVAGTALACRALNAGGSFWSTEAPVSAYLDGQPLDAQQAKSWQTFYGSYLEAILAGPLHWQGVVDLGYLHDKLAAFRITELGAYVLLQQPQLSAAPLTADGPRLSFLPDGRLRLEPLGAGPEVVNLLGLLGQVQVGPDGQLDYTLTAASVSAAFAAGWESERLLAELAEAAGRPVPAELAARLGEWEARYGEVQIYSSLALVELADDYALAELLAGTSLSGLLLYRFSPRLIAVRPEGLAEWRAELVAKGYTPRMEA